MKILNFPVMAGIGSWFLAAPAAQAQIVKKMQLDVPAIIEVLAFDDPDGWISVMDGKNEVKGLITPKGGPIELKDPGPYRLVLYVTPRTPDFKVRLRFSYDPSPDGKQRASREVELDRVGPDFKASLPSRGAEGKSRHALSVSDQPGEPLLILK